MPDSQGVTVDGEEEKHTMEQKTGVNEGTELERKRERQIKAKAGEMRNSITGKREVERQSTVGGLRWELKRKGIQAIKANSRSWSEGNSLDWRYKVGLITPSEMSGCLHADSNHCQPNTSPITTHYSISQPQMPASLATHVAFVMIPLTSHCRWGLTCHCTWALAPVLLSRLFCVGSGSSSWPEKGETAIDFSRWKTCWGWRPEVVGLRLHRLSGFKGCWRSETAQRTEAFIIRKVTGFSESNSAEKWTAAMAASTKTPPFFLLYAALGSQQ